MDDTWRSSIRTLSMVFGMILAAFVVGAGPQGTPPLGPLVFSDVVTGGAMIVAVALATGAAVVAFRFGDSEPPPMHVPERVLSALLARRDR